LFSALRLRWRRDSSQVAQHAQLIPRHPLLFDPAVPDSADGDTGHGGLPSRRGNAGQVAALRARGRPAGREQVALGDQLADGEAKVRERAANSVRPASPRTSGPDGSCRTYPAAKKSAAYSSLPLLQNSSTMRRASALFCSDMAVPPWLLLRERVMREGSVGVLVGASSGGVLAGNPARD
jgi:hypothetical protein